MNKDLREKIQKIIVDAYYAHEEPHSSESVFEVGTNKIMSLIAQEQKSLLEKIKLEKKKTIKGYYEKYCECDGECFGECQQSRDWGYNKAVDDLDQLKAHLTTGGG